MRVSRPAQFTDRSRNHKAKARARTSRWRRSLVSVPHRRFRPRWMKRAVDANLPTCQLANAANAAPTRQFVKSLVLLDSRFCFFLGPDSSQAESAHPFFEKQSPRRSRDQTPPPPRVILSGVCRVLCDKRSRKPALSGDRPPRRTIEAEWGPAVAFESALRLVSGRGFSHAANHPPISREIKYAAKPRSNPRGRHASSRAKRSPGPRGWLAPTFLQEDPPRR